MNGPFGNLGMTTARAFERANAWAAAKVAQAKTARAATEAMDPATAGLGAGAPRSTQAPRSTGPSPIDRLIAALHEQASLGADGDLASLLFAEQIRDHNTRIRTMLGQIKMISNGRESLTNEITRLRQLETELRAMKEQGGHDDDHRFAYPDASDGAPEALDKFEGVIWRKVPVPDERSGTITLERKENGARIGGDAVGLTIADVSAEIKRLEGFAQQLDSDREVRMIQLNSLISKKGNLVQLLSNLDKKKHDTEGAVISNLR